MHGNMNVKFVSIVCTLRLDSSGLCHFQTVVVTCSSILTLLGSGHQKPA